VGHADVNFPEEIALAADCHTMLMTGDPAQARIRTAGRVDTAASQPFCHLLEAIVAGRYDFVDLICATGGDRWLSILDGVLAEEKRNDPALRFGDSCFIERLRSTGFQHRAYNLARMRDFAGYLGQRFGRPVTDTALREAIALTNETRRLLAEVSRRRKLPSPEIGGCDALRIFMASMLTPKRDFNDRVTAFLQSPPPSADRDRRARIFVSGSNVDDLALYELIESFAAVVVGEDGAFGDRYADLEIATDGDPMEALADRYTYKPLDPWMLGMRARLAYRVDAAMRAHCHGAIFFHLRRDDPVAWDWPDQKALFESRGIPVLLLRDQDYAFDAAAAAGSVAEFIDSLVGRQVAAG
jgi:hypothetical protein